MKRASSWKESFYIMNYHPNNAVRMKMRLKIYGAAIVIIAALAVVSLVSWLYLIGG
jgi:hypothetical protein